MIVPFTTAVHIRTSVRACRSRRCLRRMRSWGSAEELGSECSTCQNASRDVTAGVPERTRR